MRKIENIFTKSISIETKDPFSSYNKVLEIAKRFGSPAEKKNIYETDGPRKRLEVVFELKREIDKFSTARITFDVIGEGSTESNAEGFLNIEIIGQIETRLGSSGPILKTFNDYYLSEMLPLLKGEFSRMDDLGDELEKQIKAI